MRELHRAHSLSHLAMNCAILIKKSVVFHCLAFSETESLNAEKIYTHISQDARRFLSILRVFSILKESSPPIFSTRVVGVVEREFIKK